MAPAVAGPWYLMGSSARRRFDDENEQQGGGRKLTHLHVPASALHYRPTSRQGHPNLPREQSWSHLVLKLNISSGAAVKCGFHVTVALCEKPVSKCHDGKVFFVRMNLFHRTTVS